MQMTPPKLKRLQTSQENYESQINLANKGAMEEINLQSNNYSLPRINTTKWTHSTGFSSPSLTNMHWNTGCILNSRSPGLKKN